MENKNSLQLFAVDQRIKQIPFYSEKEVSGKDYVYWGDNNTYPNYIYSLYTRSALLQSILNGCVDYTIGDGVTFNDGISIWTDEVNQDGESLLDVIKRVVQDYWTFNNFAIQVIYNHKGDISEIYWLDVCKCRLNKERNIVYYSDDFVEKKSYTRSNKILEYPIFDPTKKDNTQVYFYQGYNGRGTYGLPKYCGAITAIETQIEISKFHLNEILNNFSGSAIINFNGGVPDEETKAQYEKQIRDKFTSSENAGRFIVTWNNGKDNAVTIERLSEDNFDERYNALKESVNKEIFISMRATPALFGCNPENNGFSEEEYAKAFELFNKTMISPAQDTLIKCFNRIFQLDNSINFIPFTLNSAKNNIEQ